MSATATRMPLAAATAIATELVALLADCCLRIELCGSIRRTRPDIGDIDLIAIPKTEPVTDPMFGERTGQTLDVLDARCDELWAAGVLEQRLDAAGHRRWGPKSKRMSFRGLGVDLNAVEPSTLGVWMAIRTGPAIFSHRLVTPRSQRIRIEGVDDLKRPFGLLPPGFTFPKGSGFALHRFGGRVATPEEADFFAAIGLPYVAPERRR
jgi:DNA polymerase/3'-5' exonuclease PolX